MNYKKSLIYSALSLGFAFAGNAQGPDYSLNGLGRSIISNNTLGGASIEDDAATQKANISGYNLFDLQTNLDLDSTFNAQAIFRTRSPYGTSFGSKTTFEFRQFSMGGNVKGLEYQLGDIRIQLTPYTVFNSDVAGTGYNSEIFEERKDIIEYENFNFGNTWMLQGASGQYAWNLGEQSGLGLYGFTTRTVNTNNLETPDQLLSGGRLEYALDANMKFGLNDVYMYDLAVESSEYDHNVNVTTADFNYERETSSATVKFNLEGGFSSYIFTDNINEVDSGYQDATVDLDFDYGLKNAGIVLGFDFRRVGAAFVSPTAQTRRYAPGANPLLFNTVKGNARSQMYFDQFTSEEVYNSRITPALMAFNQYYNNLNPYGAATPNRMVIGVNVATDTSITAFDAGLKFDYGTELVGEGGSDLRNFIVVNGGTVAHLGNLLDLDRQLDINAGVRYESTSRNAGAEVALNSMLLDFGVTAEVANKVDLLGGFKYFSAAGNEFIGVRDGFNLVSSFNEYTIDVSEVMFSAGARIRFSEKQAFSLNYNVAQFVDNEVTNSNLNIGQLFFNFTGKF